MQRTIHYVIAFGIVLAAHVLHDADVAAFHYDFGRIIVAPEGWAEMLACRVRSKRGSAIRRTRKEDRRVLRAFGHEDDGVKLDTIAHGNHNVAARVVPSVLRNFELRRRFAG